MADIKQDPLHPTLGHYDIGSKSAIRSRLLLGPRGHRRRFRHLMTMSHKNSRIPLTLADYDDQDCHEMNDTSLEANYEAPAGTNAIQTSHHQGVAPSLPEDETEDDLEGFMRRVLDSTVDGPCRGVTYTMPESFCNGHLENHLDLLGVSFIHRNVRKRSGHGSRVTHLDEETLTHYIHNSGANDLWSFYRCSPKVSVRPRSTAPTTRQAFPMQPTLSPPFVSTVTLRIPHCVILPPASDRAYSFTRSDHPSASQMGRNGMRQQVMPL